MSGASGPAADPGDPARSGTPAAANPPVAPGVGGTGRYASWTARGATIKPGAERAAKETVGVGRSAWDRSKTDNVSLVAAGVAFYAMLAIFPGIIGVVSVYALVADPGQIRTQLNPVIRALPPGGGDLLVNQLTSAINAGSGGITTGLVISLLATVVAASAGVRALMTGLDVIHRRTETRGFLAFRLLAAGMTLGAIVLAVVLFALVAAFPVVLGHLGLGSTGQVVAEVLRWVALVALAVFALAILYRYGPAGGSGSRRLFTVGIAVALLGWLVSSIAFSLYVANFSHYNRAYGALAAVIVLLLWLYLSAYAVLLGAEVDAVINERANRGSGGDGPVVGVADPRIDVNELGPVTDPGTVYGGHHRSHDREPDGGTKPASGR